MKFLLPTGIGDSVWALHKIQAIRDKVAPGDPINIALVGASIGKDTRAQDFVCRFKFVNSAAMKSYGIHKADHYNWKGRYNYIEDGIYEYDGEQYCVLVPNAPLEEGIRLENWLPQYPIRWEIFDDFQIDSEEASFGKLIKDKLGNYAVFYLGPLHGNTTDGHNRNAIWKPQDWINLGREIHQKYGLEIVVVGAPYDATYFQMMVGPHLNGDLTYWHNLIGMTGIGELFSTIQNSKFCISYQAGVGIVATYLKIPTGIFWRPEGNSISPSAYLSFSESMASAWVPPKQIADGTHLPLIYGRHGVPYIMDEIGKRGWA